MPRFRLSKMARIDLEQIADYTLDSWGSDQAERYLGGLEGCFERIAEFPESGRPCPEIRPGYRCIRQDKHVVFYRVDKGFVFISRVLHERMLPSAQLFPG